MKNFNNSFKVGINGAGRIGRHLIRQICNDKRLNLSLINEINPDIKNIIYLLNHDSSYELEKKFSYKRKNILFKNQKIKLFSKKKISDINWSNYCDIVIDSSGILLNAKIAQKIKIPFFFTNVFKQYIDQYVIPNINDKNIKIKKNSNISMNICDVVATAPIIDYFLKKNSIISGHITTLHPWLNYQNLSDNYTASSSMPETYWKDYALGRSSSVNLIPKESSLLFSLKKVFKNKVNDISCFSFRTPLPVVSSAIISLTLKNKFLKKKFLENFINNESVRINSENLVSSDFKKSKSACVLDLRFLKKTKKMVTFPIWYDNEYGYSYQIIQSIKTILSKNYEA